MVLPGPALGGLVLGWTGAGVCYLLDALSFALAFYGGGVTASALSGSITRLGRPGLVMPSGTWSGALVLFGPTTSPWAGLGLLVLPGAADTTAVISRSTIVQIRAPDALLGRVTAAEQTVGQGGPDLGNLRGGPVAGWTSGTVALVSGGLLCLPAVVFVGASTPELREHAEPGAPHETTPELRDAAAPDVS